LEEGFMKVWRLFLTLLLAGLFLGACRAAEEEVAKGEPYKIGVTADITGRGADTWAPNVDALRLYFQELNAKGGIDGHPVQLIVEDNRSDGTRAGAQAKKLIEIDKVLLLVVASASPTFAPTIEQARQGKVPLWVVETGCPVEAYGPPVIGAEKPADPVVFCPFNGRMDLALPSVHFIKETAKEPVKLALVAADIPISREVIDLAEKEAKALGLEVVDKVAIPMATTDFSSYAARFIERGANWAVALGPLHIELGPFEALLKQGWEGNYAFANVGVTEPHLVRLKSEHLFIYSAKALLSEEIPEYARLREAARKYGSPYLVEGMAAGWLAGIVIEEALRQCGWPCTNEKLLEIMQTLEVDTRGITGGPIKFTRENHYWGAYYKVYRWDSAQGKVIAVTDWKKVQP